jgi:hypothetical protein
LATASWRCPGGASYERARVFSQPNHIEDGEPIIRRLSGRPDTELLSDGKHTCIESPFPQPCVRVAASGFPRLDIWTHGSVVHNSRYRVELAYRLHPTPMAEVPWPEGLESLTKRRSRLVPVCLSKANQARAHQKSSVHLLSVLRWLSSHSVAHFLCSYPARRVKRSLADPENRLGGPAAVCNP